MDDEIWEEGVLESVEANGSASLSPMLDFRAWTALTDADLSKNDLPYIDESVVNATWLNVTVYITFGSRKSQYSWPPHTQKGLEYPGDGVFCNTKKLSGGC